MKNTDVIVTITEQPEVLSPIDFGKILLISTEKDHSYREYDLYLEDEVIKTTFGEDSVTYLKASSFTKFEGGPEKLAIFGVDTSVLDFTATDLTDALNLLIQEHSDYFRVITTAEDEEYKMAIAKWANDNDKFARIQYPTTEFANDYSELGQRLLLYTREDHYLDVAECAYAAPRIPGSFDYMHRNYGEKFGADKLSRQEIAQAETKKMGYYINFAGVNMMRNGYASNDKFIDDLESRIYLKTKMQNKIMNLLVQQEKIPGDIRGLQMITAKVIETLDECTEEGIIAADLSGRGDYNVDTTKAKFDDKLRKWANIRFTYKYNHPTGKVEVNGIVQ